MNKNFWIKLLSGAGALTIMLNFVSVSLAPPAFAMFPGSSLFNLFPLRHNNQRTRTNNNAAITLVDEATSPVFDVSLFTPFNNNQEPILNYAQQTLNNPLPTLMVDDASSTPLNGPSVVNLENPVANFNYNTEINLNNQDNSLTPELEIHISGLNFAVPNDQQNTNVFSHRLNFLQPETSPMHLSTEPDLDSTFNNNLNDEALSHHNYNVPQYALPQIDLNRIQAPLSRQRNNMSTFYTNLTHDGEAFRNHLIRHFSCKKLDGTFFNQILKRGLSELNQDKDGSFHNRIYAEGVTQNDLNSLNLQPLTRDQKRSRSYVYNRMGEAPKVWNAIIKIVLEDSNWGYGRGHKPMFL